MSPPEHEVTELLQAWSKGNVAARDLLMPLVYRELRRRASAYFRRERPGHTLQPTRSFTRPSFASSISAGSSGGTARSSLAWPPK